MHGDQKWRWQTNNGSQICSALLLEADVKRVRTKREQLDIDEKEVKGGFQNINNMGRFLKAAQIMGTRRLPKLITCCCDYADPPLSKLNSLKINTSVFQFPQDYISNTLLLHESMRWWLKIQYCLDFYVLMLVNCK